MLAPHSAVLRVTKFRSGHELRNPLHGVCAGVKTLQGGTLSLPEVAEELKAIAEGLSLMVNITNDMTDLQKLRAGQFTMHFGPTSMRHVLESCVLSVRPALQHATDIELVCDDGDVPVTVSARIKNTGTSTVVSR
jgi:signal transduction histidine kinase